MQCSLRPIPIWESAAALNFVHSADAAHLVVALKSVPDDVAVGTVHDCVQVRAGDAPVVHAALLAAFPELYIRELLKEFEVHIRTEFPEVKFKPFANYGELDVARAGENPYAFS